MTDQKLLQIGIGTIIIGSMMWLGACSAINHYLGLEDDNQIEQAIEDVIEHQTGIEIDLTPE